jgi:hypothetical protein
VAHPPLVLGLIVLGAAVLVAVQTLRITSFEPDELGYTRLAIGIAHAFTPFTQSYGGASRLNQLYPLVISPLWGVFGNVTAFHLTHAWNALLMSSAAIPAYLLSREVVRARWASYLAAALVAVLPWLTIATAELTEVAAYPAAVWALLAMQRSLAQPSPRRDVIALLAIGVATYGRLQLALLAPAFVVAMLVHEIGYELSAHDRRRVSPALFMRRLGRAHAVLSGAAVLGIVIGVPLLVTGKLASAAGFYGNTLSGVSLGAPTLALARSYLSSIALGMGAIPVALAIGFACSTLVAPASRRVHAFASLTVVVVVALTLQVAEISVRFTGAVLQERYLFYIAPLLVVGMFAALLATRHPVRAVVIGSVILGLLIASTHYETPQNAFWYQVSPGLTSFYGWVVPAFGVRATTTALRTAGVVVAATGVVVALLLLRVSAVRVLIGIATAAVVFCGWETTHALVHVVDGTQNSTGLGRQSLRDVSWVDDRVPAGASVDQLVDETGGVAVSSKLWSDNAFWNRSVAGAYTTQYVPLKSYFSSVGLTVNPRSGGIVAASGGLAGSIAADRPRYLVVDSRGFPIRPVGTVVARSPRDDLELIRLAAPLRTRYLLSGVSPGGWLPLDRPAVLRLYDLHGVSGSCATVSLSFSVSQAVPGGETLTLGGTTATRRVTLVPGENATVSVPVCADGAGEPRLNVQVNAPPAAAVAVVTPRLRTLRVSPR